jgi:hypothetical protein
MKVKCIRGFAEIKNHKQSELEKQILETGKIYNVALIIAKGKVPTDEWDSGYVLDEGYPFIWSKNRFKIIKE